MTERSLSGNNNYKFSLRMGDVPVDTYNKTPKLGKPRGSEAVRHDRETEKWSSQVKVNGRPKSFTRSY